MSHPKAMQVRTPLENLLEHVQQPRVAGDETLLPTIQHLREGHGGEVLQLDRVPLALRRNSSHPVDVHHTRVRRLPDQRRALGQFLVSLALRLRDLDGHQATFRHAPRLPDRAVGAVAETVDELVAITEPSVGPGKEDSGCHDSPLWMMLSSRSSPSCPARTTNW